MKVKIERCSQPGAWWEKHLGRVVTVLWTDAYGHWTRDTEQLGATGWAGYRFLQWVAVEDVSPHQ